MSEPPAFGALPLDVKHLVFRRCDPQTMHVQFALKNGTCAICFLGFFLRSHGMPAPRVLDLKLVAYFVAQNDCCMPRMET